MEEEVKGFRRLDPDETEGRALYRAHAEGEARLSLVRSRKVRLRSQQEPLGDQADQA
jgi:hypothetical protein